LNKFFYFRREGNQHEWFPSIFFIALAFSLLVIPLASANIEWYQISQVDHNTLDNIQGGDEFNRWHLSLLEYNNLNYTTNGTWVPYTGATANVNLGAYNLTTTGTGFFDWLGVVNDLAVLNDIWAGGIVNASGNIYENIDDRVCTAENGLCNDSISNIYGYWNDTFATFNESMANDIYYNQSNPFGFYNSTTGLWSFNVSGSNGHGSLYPSNLTAPVGIGTSVPDSGYDLEVRNDQGDNNNNTVVAISSGPAGNTNTSLYFNEYNVPRYVIENIARPVEPMFWIRSISKGVILAIDGMGYVNITTRLNVVGNITAAWYNWISGDTWNSFNGSTLLFNESKLVTIYYNATQSQNVTGKIDGGTLADTQHPDGKYDGVTFNFSEVAGSPGVDMRINFTGITSFNQGVMRYKTSSLSGAYPIIQMWNYNTSTWEDYPAVAVSSTFATITQPVFDSSDHVVNGVAQMRIYKASNGNINNHYYVDWIAISKGFGTPSGEEVDPYSWHRNETDEGNYSTAGNVEAVTYSVNGTAGITGNYNMTANLTAWCWMNFTSGLLTATDC
jgi:hypothetical protein